MDPPKKATFVLMNTQRHQGLRDWGLRDWGLGGSGFTEGTSHQKYEIIKPKS
jgi:hypothetical protein